MSNLRPVGHHAVTPSFVCSGAAKVVTFAEKAFGAKVVDRYDGPDGALMHVELLIGDSVVMGGEPMPGMEPMPASLALYVTDGKSVDVTFRQAVQAGGVAIVEPKNQPWGYRAATIKDPGGNRWTICAVIEIVSRDEILRRMAAEPHG